MATVKADGYGHGAVPAARAALAGGADRLGVALVEEGAGLRAAGVDAPVLVYTEPSASAVGAMLAAGLTPAAYTPGFLDALDRAGRERVAAGEPPVAVHLKLDNRHAPCRRAAGGLGGRAAPRPRRPRAAPGGPVEPSRGRRRARPPPSRRTRPVSSAAASRSPRRLGVEPDLAHLCNSAGTLTLHDEHHDVVRTGVAIYGLRPAPGLAAHVPLVPAMRWYARVSLVKRLAAGEAVSYGLRWAGAAGHDRRDRARRLRRRGRPRAVQPWSVRPGRPARADRRDGLHGPVPGRRRRRARRGR